MAPNVPNILAPYGPYEASAAQLLAEAAKLDPGGTSLAPEHVLFAALPDPSTGELGRPWATFQWLRTTEERAKLQRLRRSLSREIAAPIPDGPSDLLRCAAHWREEATRLGVQITNDFVIWSILDDDNNRASELLDLAFDVKTQKQQLASLFQSAGGTGPVGTLSASAVDVEEYLDPVVPSQGYRYAAEFENFRARVVERVRRCEAPGFVIIYGERGSPLRAFKHILADAIADFSQPREELGKFSSCSQVRSLSLVSLCKLSAEQATKLLDDAIARSASAAQVLILDHLEELRRHASDAYAPAVAALTARLARHMNAVVVGQYWLNRDDSNNRTALNLREVLDLPDIVPTAAESYTIAHTEHALRTHFVPEWEQDGFAFNEDSFEGLEMFEPAIEEKDEQPKLLPFLAIDAVQSVVDSLKERRSSEDHIKRWVSNTALDGLDKLNVIGKAMTSSQQVRDYFADELSKAQQQAEHLKAHPELQRKGGTAYLLTRELLVIALLADGDIRFVYPSEEQLDAFRERQGPPDEPPASGGSGDTPSGPLVQFRTKNAAQGGSRGS